MQFPKSLHADGWHTHLRRVPLSAHDHDGAAGRPRWRLPALAAAAAGVVLTAGLGAQALDDPRPLDDQLSSAMQAAGGLLSRWQGQLSRGLQATLHTVTGGHETALTEAGLEGDDLDTDTPARAAPAVADQAGPTPG